MVSLIVHFAIGWGLGAVTGIPIGPVNVAIIDAAYRHHVRRAIAIGIGGAIADMLYAFLGIIGVGALIKSSVEWKSILYLVSSVVLVAYGVLTARARPVDPSKKLPPGSEGEAYFWGGVGLGLALILINPGALIGWVVVIGPQFDEPTLAEGVAAAIGVGLGSVSWFSFVAWLADHGKRLLGDRAIWISRVVGTLLIGGGLFSFGRAIYYFVKWHNGST